MLIGQTVHELAHASEYAPERQFVQTVALLEPVTPEYFPAEQPVHALAPTTTEYVQAGQAVHPPPDTYVPAAQPADTHTLEPAVDVLPDSHAVHVFDPMFEYVFAGHVVHVPVRHEVHLLAPGVGAHSQHSRHAPSSLQYG